MNLRPGPAKKAILIGTDGASMELWRRMAAWGRAPNMAKLLANGVSRPMLGTHPSSPLADGHLFSVAVGRALTESCGGDRIAMASR